MDVSLVMFKPDGSRFDYTVRKDRTIIGRNDTCHLRIPLAAISREHCELFKREGALKLRDLGSSNGTFHNSLRIEGQEITLAPGDQIVVGPVVFTVVIDGKPKDVVPVITSLDDDEGATVEDFSGVEPSEMRELTELDELVGGGDEDPSVDAFANSVPDEDEDEEVFAFDDDDEDVMDEGGFSLDDEEGDAHDGGSLNVEELSDDADEEDEALSFEDDDEPLGMPEGMTDDEVSFDDEDGGIDSAANVQVVEEEADVQDDSLGAQIGDLEADDSFSNEMSGKKAAFDDDDDELEDIAASADDAEGLTDFEKQEIEELEENAFDEDAFVEEMIEETQKEIEQANAAIDEEKPEEAEPETSKPVGYSHVSEDGEVFLDVDESETGAVSEDEIVKSLSADLDDDDVEEFDLSPDDDDDEEFVFDDEDDEGEEPAFILDDEDDK